MTWVAVSFAEGVKVSGLCPYLVNEGGKAIVEALDLLLLLAAYGMDGRVNIYVQGYQQAPVDGHGCDRGRLGGSIADPGDAVGSRGPAAEARHAPPRTP